VREIYNTKVIGSIEQGTIINSCVAENYCGYSTYGIIVTPRCDLDNNKVSTVHYLPVVRLDDWIKIDFWLIFANRAPNEVNNKLGAILDKYKLSRSLIKSFATNILREKLKEIINKKDDFEKFDKYLSDLETLNKPFNEISKPEIKQIVEDYNKVSKDIFKDLKDNKRKEFYLLENWDSNAEYYVVLLREIRKITFQLANKISHGIYEHQITASEWESNDISKNYNEENFIYSIATLRSPHIEHLIQQFFWNFGRIGVENHPSDIETQFHNRIANII
jgi:hypothetical protein